MIGGLPVASQRAREWAEFLKGGREERELVVIAVIKSEIEEQRTGPNSECAPYRRVLPHPGPR